jgi:hypothetical protein
LKLTLAAANRAIILGEKVRAPVVLTVYAGPNIVKIDTPALTQFEAQTAVHALYERRTSLWEISQHAPGVPLDIIKMQIGWNTLHPCVRADAEWRGEHLSKQARRSGP